MNKSTKVLNKQGEKLDVLIEGNEKSGDVIMFVHGFGVDKHEGFGLFDYVSSKLTHDFITVRFDFSGAGKSEGKEEDVTYEKEAEDLDAIISWVKTNITYSRLFIYAHSMGTFITSLLCPNGISSIFCAGIPNADTDYIVKRISERIRSRHGTFDEFGLSYFPRSSGRIQVVGSGFWKSLRNFKPITAIKKLSQVTKLKLVHPLQDQIVGEEYIEPYKSIKRLTFVVLPGDHEFKKPVDRERLTKEINTFFHDTILK